MSEAFQRGEDISWPFLVVDEDGDVVDLTGSELALEIWWRGTMRLELTVGDGITIDDPQPDEDDPQPPHGLVHLSAEQSALVPSGKIAMVRSRLTDTAGNVSLTPFLYLDGAIGSANHQLVLGGQQGPAGPLGPPGTIELNSGLVIDGGNF